MSSCSNVANGSSRNGRKLVKDSSVVKKAGKTGKVDDRTCVAVSRLIARLSGNEDTDCGLGMAMMKGRNRNDKLKKFCDTMTSIYVAPIEKMRKLENDLRKKARQGDDAKDGKHGKDGIDASETIFECLRVILKCVKENESDEKKNEELTCDLIDIYGAARKYIDKCEKKCESESGLRGAVMFGSHSETVYISLADFISWVCEESMDEMRYAEVPKWREARMKIIKRLLKKYIFKIFLHDNRLNLLRLVNVDFGISVNAIMETIEKDSYFEEQRDNHGSFANMVDLFGNWKQYRGRINTIPLSDLENELKRYIVSRKDSKMNFAKSTLQKGLINEQQGRDAIEGCLNLVQACYYEKWNEQLQWSNRLNATILAHLVFVGQKEEISMQLFVEILLDVIAALKVDDSKYICIGCQTTNEASSQFCGYCGLDQVQLLPN